MNVVTQRKNSGGFMNSSIYQLIVDNSPNMIWMSNREQQYEFFNRSWLAYTGLNIESALGEGWINCIHPDDLMKSLDTIKEGFSKREPYYMEYRLKRYDGEYRWIGDHGNPIYDEGNFIGYLGECQDIQDKILSRKMDPISNYDNLTNLYSRPVFIDEVSKKMDLYRIKEVPFSLILIDLDDFGQINDKHGHRSGDIVLMKVAEVVTGSIRGSDFAARYGGDEFAILLDGADELLATRILNRIEEEIASIEFEFDQHLVHLGASVGAVEYHHQYTLESLFIEVNNRMLNVKNNRKRYRNRI